MDTGFKPCTFGLNLGPATFGFFLRTCFLYSIRSAMADESEDESDDASANEDDFDNVMDEMMFGMCKLKRRKHIDYVRPHKKTEQRVLEAARERDERESTNKSFVQQTIVGYVHALIDDRETLENIREALGVKNTYNLMRLNFLY
jgi:hypothetical protein